MKNPGVRSPGFPSPVLFSFVVMILAAVAAPPPAQGAASSEPVHAACVRVTVEAGPFEIVKDGDRHAIRMDGFGRLPGPGLPRLPARIVAVAVPPDALVHGVRFEGAETPLFGEYSIEPIPLPLFPDSDDAAASRWAREIYRSNFDASFGSDSAYPAAAGEFIRSARYRKYDLVDVRITPFSWNPKTGALLYRPEVTVIVEYSLPEETVDRIDDDLARTEKIAREIIVNYDQAQTWYAEAEKSPRTTNRSPGRGLYDFVIITNDTLMSAVNPIRDGEIAKGRTVNVVATAWIYANFSGYDEAEKIRNFLREKYPSSEWGIEDVLIAGDEDLVPMRRCWKEYGGNGKPQTDFYYAELSLEDRQSWDKNGNHKWGEDENIDPIDYYAEVIVGRIPWNDEPTVRHICEKSVAFEENNDPSFKQSALLLGAFIMPTTDDAVLMELKTDPVLHPWMSDWSITKLYEQNNDYWSSFPCDYPLDNANVMSVWPHGKYAFVNWGGHGSWYSAHIYGMGMPAFIRHYDCPNLNDDYPAIIFACSCSNSDTDTSTSIGREMLKQGAVGFVGSNKISYGAPGWNEPSDGLSQSFDYYFSIYVTSCDYTQGGAHQAAIRKMYEDGLWAYEYFETFEWGSLWGNPNLSMKIDEVAPVVADIKIDGDDGPLSVPSTQTISLTVSLDPGDQAGVRHDWWIRATRTNTFWWTFPGIWRPYQVRAYVGPLTQVNDYVIAQTAIPQGLWTITFAVDEEDNAYQGTHSDSIEVDSY